MTARSAPETPRAPTTGTPVVRGSLWRDFSGSAVVAGLIAMLTGYTSTFALMVQAGHAAGLSPAMVGSWLGALAVGMGIATLGLSLRYRAPIMVVWSTPGAALLVTSLSSVPYAEAIGAYMMAALLSIAVGCSGKFDRLLRYLPSSLAAALLAGILFQLGTGIFHAGQQNAALILPLLGVYLLARRWCPRYAVPLVLLSGVGVAWGLEQLPWQPIAWRLLTPVWVTPAFSLPAMMGIALPLFIVAMASQNLPGIAVLRADGYHQVPVSPLITTTGVVSFATAGFGAHGVTLAAITAALCTSPQAHPSPQRRYIAAVVCGAANLVAGFLSLSVAQLLGNLPKALIAAVAGFALLGSIGSGLTQAMKNETEREAALMTFIVTASGMTLWGVGSAFWGVVVGMMTLWVLGWRRS